jgi:hypothetical protein
MVKEKLIPFNRADIIAILYRYYEETLKKFNQSLIIYILIIIILSVICGYHVTAAKVLTNSPFVPSLQLQEIPDLISNGLPRPESLFTSHEYKALPFMAGKITIIQTLFQRKWTDYPLLSVFLITILFFSFFYRQTRNTEEHYDYPIP